jgi:CRISPR system Cascade subunit CasE
MPFLSRLLPDPRSREALRALADAYEMHRDVLSAFPDAPDGPGRQAFGVLHRVEADGDSRPVVLVQSQHPPDWTRLLERGWTRAAPLVKPFDPQPQWFRPGQLLRFRLRANPTRCLTARSRGPDGNPVAAGMVGKRVEIRDPDQQADWLGRQGTRHGFTLRRLAPRPSTDGPVYSLDTASRRIEGRRPATKQPPITLGSVLFEGVLEVADPEALVKALLEGIGRAKAFGCGLLSIART